MVCLEITNSQGKDKVILVEAVVLQTVTTDLPTQPIPDNHGWKHLMGLQLVDLDFGEPGCIDVFLGAEVLSKSIHQS